ncbi:hypothetical protein CYANOKiyG1_64040 [Okeania sp. KiyG1]|nr:hypothetical protein CYANOKiyG1_64040 [Okeania sp. KiyG1]
MIKDFFHGLPVQMQSIKTKLKVQRQLTYKCEWYGSELIIADRFYPSSQICSHCGHQQKMSLNVRLYECNNCGFKADRDFNAAVNLENYARQ